MGERQTASFQMAVDDFIMYALGGKKNQASSRFGPSHLNKIQLSIFSEYAGKNYVVLLRKINQVSIYVHPTYRYDIFRCQSLFRTSVYYVYNAMNKYTTQSCNIAHTRRIFSSNQIVHKISFSICFWASDPLFNRFQY